jgi:hypothetical protein
MPRLLDRKGEQDMTIAAELMALQERYWTCEHALEGRKRTPFGVECGSCGYLFSAANPIPPCRPALGSELTALLGKCPPYENLGVWLYDNSPAVLAALLPAEPVDGEWDFLNRHDPPVDGDAVERAVKASVEEIMNGFSWSTLEGPENLRARLTLACRATAHRVASLAALPDIATLTAQLDAMKAAAADVLSHRVGDFPGQGWLKDNDVSRAALGRLAAALKGQTP